MKEGQVKIVGIAPYQKDGKVSYNIYGVTPYSPYEVENGAIGEKVVKEWTNRIDCSILKPGDIVEFSYAKGFRDMAVLNNITVVTPAK